jgi:hypothetical protein
MVLRVDEVAAAQKRVALVIGNAAYQHTGPLANPGNDAADMAAILERLGFTVFLRLDLDKAGMDRAVREFAMALDDAEAGVFFFAGHGLEVSGVNYLVPVDAKLSTAAALDFEMVRLELVQGTMERATSTSVLFIDACRDNPLARNLARALGTRSTQIGRGLAAIDSGIGTLVSFSTKPGYVALDGAGRNSPFAAALVKAIATPGEDLTGILISVRNEVQTVTRGKQVPWENSALRARFYFSPPKAVVEVPKVPPTPPAKDEAKSGAKKPPSEVASAKPPPATGLADCPDDFRAFVDSKERLACTCSAEATKRGYVRGMNVYTANSSVCRAALHAGAVAKKGGSVTLIPEPARKAYPGVTRNGVTSYNDDASEGSFRFADVAVFTDCPDDFKALVDTTERLACTCSAEATKRGYVRGMNVYTANSSVCQAALHAGAVAKKGGSVTLIPEPARKAYPGVTRNGVTSYNDDASEGSFRFAGVAAFTDCPDDFKALVDTTERLVCTCSAEATKRGYVRGMNVYTANSSVCQAALHAGAVTKMGGQATLIPEPARKAYPGVTRNGVTSYNDDASEGSFRFADVAAFTDCPDDFKAFTGSTERLTCTCSVEATGRGYVRGLDVYTANSSVCRAALHAGVVTKKGGSVTLIPEAGRKTYAGVTRNGVISYNDEASEGSFRFAAPK